MSATAGSIETPEIDHPHDITILFTEHGDRTQSLLLLSALVQSGQNALPQSSYLPAPLHVATLLA